MSIGINQFNQNIQAIFIQKDENNTQNCNILSQSRENIKEMNKKKKKKKKRSKKSKLGAENNDHDISSSDSEDEQKDV